MSEVRAAKRTRPTSDKAERERIVVKVERSLARLDAGEGVPHAEVLAMIEARYRIEVVAERELIWSPDAIRDLVGAV